jgi:Predicted xylanase/chitin deacetylase
MHWCSLESALAVATQSARVSDRTESSPSQDENLIQNGDLGQGTTGAPKGWTRSSWGKLKSKFIYPIRGSKGSTAAAVVVSHWSSGGAGWRFRPILASEHTVYAFSDEYNSDVVTNVTVEFTLSTGAKDYEWLGDAEATGGKWKTFSSQITVPEGTTSLSVLHELDKNGSLKIGSASVRGMRADPFPQGMVTLVFDDGRASQFENALPILKAGGLKTTYAIITQPQRVRDSSIKAFMTWAEIAMLHDEGNEIAAHSRAHRDLTTLTRSEMRGEVQGAYQDLVTRGLTPKTFVYPYGAVNSKVERLVRSTGFSGARGSYFGLDGACTDKFNLHDIFVGKTTPAENIERWIDQAIDNQRWLVLELHDVLSEGGDEYSITPKKLRSIVTYIRHTGIQVVTLQEGIRLMNPERNNPECQR